VPPPDNTDVAKPTASIPENPFTLNNRREELLKLFLITTRPCWNPVPPLFRARGPAEDIQHYVEERKTHYNRQAPKIANIVHLFIPAVVRRTGLQNGNLAASLAFLPPDHLDTLTRIYQWHHASGWRGMMALFPWTSLECTRYDFALQDGIHPSGSLLEAHRRVLELERVCHDLTDYLCRSMSKTDCIHGFSEQHLRHSLAVITAGGGLFGAGKDFWTRAPGSLQAIGRITKALGAADRSSCMASDAKWLSEHRKSAFHRTYTVTDELTWGMPLLTLCYKYQATLAHLDEKDKADSILKHFQDDLQERTRLYIMDLEPLLLYGGQLTKYVRELHGLCNEHFSALGRIPGTKYKLSFPTNCKLLTLNQDGKLIGPNGQPTPGGHFSLPEATLSDGDSRPPLPFPEACCDIHPDVSSLQQLAEDRVRKEDERLKEMLTTIFGNADDPSMIAAMRRGRSNVLRRLRDDSHLARLTAVLPPTASMPSAAYAPEQLFKA
jgi:hypothetical protein